MQLDQTVRESASTPQPALYQAVASLESEVGFQLLERHARGVALTPAGEAFLAKARLIEAFSQTDPDPEMSLQAARVPVDSGLMVACGGRCGALAGVLAADPAVWVLPVSVGPRPCEKLPEVLRGADATIVPYHL